MNRILTATLIIFIFSCQNEKDTNSMTLKSERKIETDSTTVYKSEKRKHKNIKQPKKTIIRNLEIDTTKLFGLWSQDPTGPFADFYISSKSFNVVDFDGEGIEPYIIDKNNITVFYGNLIHNGIITLVENDTLKIQWTGTSFETKYLKFQ